MRDNGLFAGGEVQEGNYGADAAGYRGLRGGEGGQWVFSLID